MASGTFLIILRLDRRRFLVILVSMIVRLQICIRVMYDHRMNIFVPLILRSVTTADKINSGLFRMNMA
jgi:hypothetical protein